MDAQRPKNISAVINAVIIPSATQNGMCFDADAARFKLETIGINRHPESYNS
jgi:hypothetical protein